MSVGRTLDLDGQLVVLGDGPLWSAVLGDPPFDVRLEPDRSADELLEWLRKVALVDELPCPGLGTPCMAWISAGPTREPGTCGMASPVLTVLPGPKAVD
jgi:hypothetical protein